MKPTGTLQTAKDCMNTHKCRRLPVADETQRVRGIIIDRDLRLAVNSPLTMRERWQDNLLLAHTEVGASMSPDPISTAPETPLRDTITLMLTHTISGMPVVEHTRLIGVISTTDTLIVLRDLLA